MRDYARGVRPRDGDLLAHVSTLDVVRDMERIRQALGEGPLNYIGLSYGSKMGALYADTYPQNVRAMVLDGVLPPALTLQELTLGQIEAFEKSLNASACAQDRDCSFVRAARTSLDGAAGALKQQPLPAGNNRCSPTARPAMA